jgi:carboxymethylenebutenolidase
MELYIARPDAEGQWPGVLVFMEIFGVNSHIRSVTERIASAGYVAVAMNYYHRTTRNMELGYDEAGVTTGREHKDKTTREGIYADTQAVLAYLKQRPEVKFNDKFATIGFCFGGHVAYLVATMPDIVATASFYGGGIATSSPGHVEPTVNVTPEINGDVLCLFGLRDPLIPEDDMETIEQALIAAGKHHEVVRYPDAGHGFFCDQRDDFLATAAADAWHRVLNLFHRNFQLQTIR